MNGSDEIANKAIELLREIYTNLGPQLRTQQVRLGTSAADTASVG